MLERTSTTSRKGGRRSRISWPRQESRWKKGEPGLEKQSFISLKMTILFRLLLMSEEIESLKEENVRLMRSKIPAESLLLLFGASLFSLIMPWKVVSQS